MNGLIPSFKNSAHLAGEALGLPNGRLIREFGLSDFLENSIKDKDDAPSVCIKAIGYFCDGESPSSEVFKFAVFAVCTFLKKHYTAHKSEPPIMAMRDLITILRAGIDEIQIRQWITSHFGASGEVPHL